MVASLLDLWPLLLAVAIPAVQIAAAVHVLLRKRDVRAAVGWMGLIWLVPLVGAALYAFLGINRIQRKAQTRRPEPAGYVTAEGSGEGEATHLGRFEITELDHPTINLCSLAQDPPEQPEVADLLRDGTFEFVAADASTLYGSYSFLFVPPEQGGFFTLYVEGGTQRLAGATGELHLNFEKSGVSQPSDPLFLGEVTLEPAVFEGEISVPRPGPGL